MYGSISLHELTEKPNILCFYPSKVCIRSSAFIQGPTVLCVLRANINGQANTGNNLLNDFGRNRNCIYDY